MQMSGNSCLSKGYPQSEVILKLKTQTQKHKQSMRARNYCAHHNTRDHWTLRCMNRCPGICGLSEERPSVFKPEASLVLIYRPNVAGMKKAESTLRSPLIEPQTCGVEAPYTLLDPIR
ncbi:hypothetical protein TNCV_3084181 [Trichonephila clavipes]|nr:hypothetical protein TNCV_3084181 [Trichonephila clavipes]